MTTLVPILAYHRVASDSPSSLKRWTVAPEVFADHVRAFVDGGCSPLLLNDLADAVRGRCELPDRPLVLTFDDGFADNLPAFEQLAANGLSATLYVTTGWVGKPAMVTPGDLGRLSGYRVEVGAHGVSHVRLDEIPRCEASAEITDSRTYLQDLLAQPIRTFAYPHGAHDEVVRRSVISAGYQSAAAVKNALSHLGDDPFALARWTVTAETSAAEVVELLNGGLASKARVKERWRTRGYRTLRRLRRRLAGRLRAL